ncbi:MAG: hypothetical protein LDL51_11745 [Chloroflexi bacterium]|nr:hypothetical protein [Chloroflexota bacterium]
MRSGDLKYLGYGFGVGASIAGFFFGGIFLILQIAKLDSGGPLAPIPTPPAAVESAPSPTETPAAATEILPTVTATAPPPTSTPTLPPPTATLSETEALIASGNLFFAGPLSRETQIRLYEASLAFVAPTYAESKKMAVAINQARFSDPSTTCGPLSVAILQKAGILSEELVAHDFFLINPDLGKDRLVIKSFFPPEKYSNTRRKVRIDREDWRANPLYPGDFLYLYAGTGGNFEHMLVVTRVDNLGRAYSVTNYNTEEGFVINEALLYDPADPNAGLFSQWTEKQYALLGSTGFAGYEIWRLKENQ